MRRTTSTMRMMRSRNEKNKEYHEEEKDFAPRSKLTDRQRSKQVDS